MFKNKLIVLSLITVCAIIAATVFVKLRAPQTEKEKPAFFPELTGKIESVNHIAIKGYANSINLSRINNKWVIDEFDGYPALPDKVKSAVLGAVELKINAPKTALPRLYHRLGVEGPEVEDTTSLLFTLEDNENNKLVNVIVGKPRRSSASQSTPGLYVRKPEEASSYLVDGVIDISAIKTDWIERTLFDIPAEAIQSVRIDHADGDTFTLLKKEKGQEQFELQYLPLGKKLASELIIKRFGSILSDMQISGARSQEKFEAHGDVIQAQIVTFEGIITNITAFLYDELPYASFEFRYDETLLDEDKSKAEDVKAFIGNLNARTLNWWFEIPEFKFDVLKKRSNIVMRDAG
ncbi:MAG: DUF4340 domain-containing protein [Proteobacteria bacterium]|nr:DUF4340 domain-containing protein [Pseudomonadota bacterium]NOG60984.1 DUF4340 domain-containing protein [Pseudomonadota bacterium]